MSDDSAKSTSRTTYLSRSAKMIAQDTQIDPSEVEKVPAHIGLHSVLDRRIRLPHGVKIAVG